MRRYQRKCKPDGSRIGCDTLEAIHAVSGTGPTREGGYQHATPPNSTSGYGIDCSYGGVPKTSNAARTPNRMTFPMDKVSSKYFIVMIVKPYSELSDLAINGRPPKWQSGETTRQGTTSRP